MERSDTPLKPEVKEELETCVKAGSEMLGLDLAAASPDDIQECVFQKIGTVRESSDLPEHERQELGLLLGCLWGQTVCDRLGWQWAQIDFAEGGEFYGIVTPDRSHAILPLHYIDGLLKDREKDHTSLLLYNMLVAGKLPPAEAGEYSVLG
ncbi:MAG: hypothetical protein AB1646_23600 [Thermodesulfobacteriota bacterium]